MEMREPIHLGHPDQEEVHLVPVIRQHPRRADGDRELAARDRRLDDPGLHHHLRVILGDGVPPQVAERDEAEDQRGEDHQRDPAPRPRRDAGLERRFAQRADQDRDDRERE
jgi:hypothetical protein